VVVAAVEDVDAVTDIVYRAIFRAIQIATAAVAVDGKEVANGLTAKTNGE